MTFFNEVNKINDSSNLLDSIRRINVDEAKEKRFHVILSKKRNQSTKLQPQSLIYIEKLVPNKRGMSNYDILTLQTETAKRHIEFAIRNRIPKIVFIHWGEGIPKAELDFLLDYIDLSRR
jgi:hypothetical protein